MTLPKQPPLYRRVRPFGQELQTVPLWLSGMYYHLVATPQNRSGGFWRPVADKYGHRSASSVSTVSKPPTRRALAQTAVVSTMRKPFNTRYQRRKSSNLISRTNSRNKQRQSERRARSAKSRPLLVAIWLASELSNKILST
jgi:hypothetical protein